MSGHEKKPGGESGKLSRSQAQARPSRRATSNRADCGAPVHTQATYRLLTSRGLAPNEAANLTAFLVGLEVHRSPWSIGQVNRMLFLRALYRSQGWGVRERHV